MKTYQIKATEDEILAIITFHANKVMMPIVPDVETTKRIHDLTKRLNNSTDTSDEDKQPEATNEPQQAIPAAKAAW